MFTHHIYEQARDFLQPSQGIVSLILVSVIGIALVALFWLEPVSRTAITLWFLLP